MEEVIKAFAPVEDTVTRVHGWLEEYGIAKHRITHSDNKGWLAFDATAEEAENLFYTEYFEHEHSTTGTLRIGCDK